METVFVAFRIFLIEKFEVYLWQLRVKKRNHGT